MIWQIRRSCTSIWRGEGGATPLKMALKRIVLEGDSLIMWLTIFVGWFYLWALPIFSKTQIKWLIYSLPEAFLDFLYKKFHGPAALTATLYIDISADVVKTSMAKCARRAPRRTSSWTRTPCGALTPLRIQPSMTLQGLEITSFLKMIIKSISGLCSLLLKWPVCWNKRSLRWDQRIQLPRQIHCQGKCGLEFSQKRRVTRNSLKTEKIYFFKAVAEDVVSRANNLEQVSSFWV